MCHIRAQRYKNKDVWGSFLYSVWKQPRYPSVRVISFCFIHALKYRELDKKKYELDLNVLLLDKNIFDI